MYERSANVIMVLNHTEDNMFRPTIDTLIHEALSHKSVYLADYFVHATYYKTQKTSYRILKTRLDVPSEKIKEDRKVFSDFNWLTKNYKSTKFLILNASNIHNFFLVFNEGRWDFVSTGPRYIDSSDTINHKLTPRQVFHIEAEM